MTDRPLRADARRNRDQVLAAAREAFAKSGITVPLDEIAARAGVGPGTVYRHFPTKEALFEAVMVARVQDLLADARAREEAADPEAAFFGLLARISEEVAAKQDLSDALGGAGLGLLAGVRDDFHAAFHTLLVRAQQVGAVRTDVSAHDLIALLKGLRAAVRDSEDPGLHQRVLAVLRDGLRPPR